MSGFELNKLAASILLASLIAMIAVTLVDALYKPSLHPYKRGYEVVVTSDSGATAAMPEEEVKIDIAALMKAANADAGKDTIKKCLACHSLEEGGAHKIGPNLWHIVGAKKASKEGYKYSAALAAKGGVWDDESLFHFVHKPQKFIPGTKMSFAGLTKLEDIANVIAYLKTLSK